MAVGQLKRPAAFLVSKIKYCYFVYPITNSWGIMSSNQHQGRIVDLAEYQMEKTLGKCFRTRSGQYTGIVRILGTWYDYKVVEGIPDAGVMLEVVDYNNRELLVRVNNALYESDVNYIGNF